MFILQLEGLYKSAFTQVCISLYRVTEAPQETTSRPWTTQELKCRVGSARGCGSCPSAGGQGVLNCPGWGTGPPAAPPAHGTATTNSPVPRISKVLSHSLPPLTAACLAGPGACRIAPCCPRPRDRRAPPGCPQPSGAAGTAPARASHGHGHQTPPRVRERVPLPQPAPGEPPEPPDARRGDEFPHRRPGTGGC